MGNTINLKGMPIRKEGVTAVTMLPGHVIAAVPRTKSNGTGSAAFVGTSGDQANSVVFENELVGNGITDAYVSGDNVLYGVWPSGGEVLCRVAAGLAAVSAGAILQVADDGTLEPLGAAGRYAFAKAIEAVDNSGGGAEAFIEVEVL